MRHIGTLEKKPIYLKGREGVSKPKRKKARFSIPLLGGRVPAKDLAIFTRQFATMINAGIPVVQCLQILSEQTSKKYFKKILKTVKADVEGGKTLGDAMGKYPGVFTELIRSMVDVGEQGGVLGNTLARMAEYLEKVNSLKRKVKSAMAYPSVVLIISVLVTLLLLIFLIPTFASLYESAGVELPGPTKIVMGIAYFLRHRIILLTVGFIAFVIAFKKAINTKKGKIGWHRFLLKLPIFGGIIAKSSISRFSRTLGIMIKSGVPILQALDITSKTSGNKVIEGAVLKARQSVSEGKTLSQPLKDSGVFPPMVTHLVAVGEETGKLSEMLEKLADFYDDEVDSAVSGLSSVIEPIMLVFVGTMVGAIMLAMYLPIFNLASTVK